MSMFEAVLSSQQQDNTTAYSTIPGLALTPGAGTYLAIATVPMSSGAANYTYLALAVDGTEIAETENEHYHEGSIWGLGIHVGQNTLDVITVGAGEEIQARWKSSTTVNRYAPQGRLVLISVASGDATRVAQAGDTTGIGATPVKVSDFGTPGADEYLVTWSGSLRVGAISDTIGVAVYVNDVEVAHTERRYFCESSLTTVTSWPLALAAVVTVGAGEELSVRMWRISGSGNATCHERVGIRLKGRILLQVSGTATDTEATADTDKAIDDLTHINPPAGDYLAIVSWVNSYGSIGINCITTSKFFEETTEVADSAIEYVWGDSLDNMDMGLTNAAKVAPNGSEDVSAQWRGNNTETRTAEERTFVLMLDAAAAAREQEGFRFRDDDADEDEATWLDDQDVNVTVGTSANFRLRTLVDTATADPPAEGLQLEYRKVGDAATEWRKVPLT